jgi:hypothetical protein
MENLEPQISFPRFLQCTKSEFEAHEKAACELLGYSNELATNYCNPLIDFEGKFYFTINPEISKLFTEKQLDTCIPYEDIVLPTPEPIK